MGLGSVALGYGHPEVTRAAIEAVEDGVVGPLAPVLEEELAAEISGLIPWVEQVRFLKTGAEAMAAAVRLARVATGRDRILGCGYHGWLDWCQSAEGCALVPPAHLYGELPFNDAAAARKLIRATGDGLAAVVFEPVILREPDPEWLAVLREETERVGALLVVDEIKTVCRLAVGGACERYGIRPDLVVMGKAIANGFPLAAVGGRAAGDGRRLPHLDLVHPGHRVRLARRRAGHPRRLMVARRCRNTSGGSAAGCSTVCVSAAPGAPRAGHRRGRHSGDVLPSVRRRGRVPGRHRRAAPARDFSSSAPPTTSSPWLTTSRDRSHARRCWQKPSPPWQNLPRLGGRQNAPGASGSAIGPRSPRVMRRCLCQAANRPSMASTTSMMKTASSRRRFRRRPI